MIIDMLDNTIPSPLPEQRPQATKEPLDLDVSRN